MSPTHTDSALDSHQDLDSAELLKFYLEYMRTPSPEIQEAGTTSRYWDLGSDLPADVPSSSPTFSCQTSGFYDSLEDEEQALMSENDNEDYFPCEVPVSSSPPELTSSSPRSGYSDTSDDTSTSLRSSTNTDPAAFSQHNPSCVDLTTGAVQDSYDDFGRQLHQLLVAVKEKQPLEEEYLVLRQETDDALDGGNSDYDSDSLDNDSRYSGTSDEQSAETSSIEKPSVTKPQKIADHEHCSLQLSTPEHISPLCFAPQTVAEHRETIEPDTPKTYRVIKRAQSYEPNDDGPLAKRRKIAREQGTHGKDRIYARRTASLRRADSLRSVLEDNSPAVHDCVPTVPATPVSRTPKPRGSNSYKAPECSVVWLDPVPIIAPPQGHAAKLPLSFEALAKLRLTRYLEREIRGHVAEVRDWFLNNALKSHAILETRVGIGKRRRDAVINWLLDVLPIEVYSRASRSASCSSLSSVSSVSTSSSSDTFSTEYSSSTSSSQCTSDSPEPKLVITRKRPNLQDQLETSPETRFHAAWMFLSYFHLTIVAKSGPKTSPLSSKVCSIDEDGLNLLVWDIAVACLAISVKFHRDFLDPLLPVFAQEYVSLAPHELSREDLESAHRDVLSTFDYMLGVTPQPVMDELWSALPSLRALLDFDAGWKYAMGDAWTRLFAVLDEPDVQRFSVSMLTVAALTEGILESLIDHYCRGAAKKTRNETTAEDCRSVQQALRQKFSDAAKEDAEGVFCDIQALTGITDVDLLECSMWMAGRN